MAKAKAQIEQAAEEKKRHPLDGFIHHQGRALEETGKALVSLLPRDFRDHAGKALDESKAGLEYLVDGVVDTLESGLDQLRSKPKEDEPKDKVKVDVE
jgi:hypothetical protein